MNADKAAIVLQKLAEGLSLRKSAEFVGCSASTVLRHKEADEAFAEQYARARIDGYLIRADEIVDIADTPQMGEIRTEKADGSVEIKWVDMVEHRKLRIGSRQWELSKMLPKVYGDKLDVSAEVKSSVTIMATPHDEKL